MTLFCFLAIVAGTFAQGEKDCAAPEKTISVAILGQVHNPGLHEITSKAPTAWDAWEKAGGGTRIIWNRLFITRKNEDGERETHRFVLPLRDSDDEREKGLREVSILDGDILFFPEIH